jgi:electron transport complex protein RnfD
MLTSERYLDMRLRTSPHDARGVKTRGIMRTVVVSLAPVCAYAVYAFGVSALLVLLTTSLSCLAAEALFCGMSKKRSTLPDWSAAITGVLLGLTLPPAMPLWMAAVGGFVAIALGKALFGGLGFNVFNPALVGRAFLQAAFPQAITTWSPVFAEGRFWKPFSSTFAAPLMKPVADGFSGATPLAALKFEGQAANATDLLLGSVAGSTGETCAVLILAAGVLLAAKRMLDWRIPAGILGTAAVLSAALHAANPAYPSAAFTLFSGGLMLGAVFMATDMVTSPVTDAGTWLYAVLIGAVVVVIRVWGGLPEGVMYAILLGNAAAPGFDRLTQPVPYGKRRKTA